MRWSRAFEDPVPHPDGGTMRTLRQAALHILALPKREAALPHWQLAMHCLIAAAEDREPLLHASIAMRKALNRDQAAPASRSRRAKQFRIIR